MDKDLLRGLQLRELEILRYIDRICRDNNLSYSLTGGTLLGAVRHGGFIPWDDDIDIVMPRKDYDTFLAILQKDDTGFVIQSIQSDPEYWNSYAKLRLKGTKCIPEEERNIESENGIFVDVFPLDLVPKEKSWQQKLQAFRVKLLKSVIIRKRGIITPYTSKLTKLFLVLYRNKSIKELAVRRDKYMTRYNNVSTSEYYVNLGSNYHFEKQTMKKEWFFPTTELTFEGYAFKVMNNYQGYLERIYGKNYMELPPEEKRRTHMPFIVELGE